MYVMNVILSAPFAQCGDRLIRTHTYLLMYVYVGVSTKVCGLNSGVKEWVGEGEGGGRLHGFIYMAEWIKG